MEAEGYTAQMDEVNNVYTVIPGAGSGPTLYVSAHLDTVFPLDTPLNPVWKRGLSTVPASRTTAGGWQRFWLCSEFFEKNAGIQPVGTLILAGNVGEEGLGNLRGMRHFFQNHRIK